MRLPVPAGFAAALVARSWPDDLGELDLTGHAGVLLGPQLEQGFRDPAVDGPEPVQPRVTSGAEGDQSRVDITRPAVMDDQPFSGPADAAAMVVAGAGAAPVASQAPPPAKQLEAAAGAAEGDLGVEEHGYTR